MLRKMFGLLLLFSSPVLAQDNGQSILIEALILIAILFVMAGVPLYKKMKV